MQEWLKNKKHIRTITRDRATAYAKVIETELPNVMQVAERFHLHQNLLETIRTCLRRELPSSIRVSQDELDSLERTKTLCGNTGSRNRKYPILWMLENCIQEFRVIFEHKNMSYLYLFIEKFKVSSIKELVTFAVGLEKDIDAIENAVVSELSNGFVEGRNKKLKMIKRTMYGRSSKKLLEAKLMYRINY